MGAIINTIVSFVSTYVQAIVKSVVSASVTDAVIATVTKVITYAVLAIVAGVVLQVLGALFGAEKVTAQIAQVLYMIAIIAVLIAAYLASSILLALVFLGGAIVFMFLVDTLFGTDTRKTFTDAAVKVVEAVVDIIGDVIEGAVDIIGSGLGSLFGGNFWLYALLGVGGYMLLKSKRSSQSASQGVELRVSTEKPGRDPSTGYAF